MKRQFLAILIGTSMIAGGHAIVIVPPVVYFATISILSVVFNMFVWIFFWIAVQGVATKKLFGKPFHVFMGFFISSIGKLFFAMLLTIGLVLYLSPLTTSEAIDVAAYAAGLFFLALFLARFRQMRNTKKQLRVLSGLVVFSLAVFAISFFSILFAIEFTEISTGEKAASPALGIAEDFGMAYVPFAAREAADITEPKEPAAEKPVVNALWVQPHSSKKCIVSIGEETISFTPEKSCIEQTGTGLERVYCPVKIQASQIKQKGTFEMVATGGCYGRAVVSIDGSKFEVFSYGG